MLEDQDLRELVPYIDWKPFFEVWCVDFAASCLMFARPPADHTVWGWDGHRQLRGKYPNRAYPKIFDDATVGTEAKKLFDDAQTLLAKILDEKLLTAKGIFGLFAANTVGGEDIEVYADEARTASRGVLHGLRQQAEKLDHSEPYLSLADFVAPKESGTALRPFFLGGC